MAKAKVKQKKIEPVSTKKPSLKNRILNLFNLTVVNKGSGGGKEARPARRKKKGGIEPVKFTSELEKAFKFFQSDATMICQDNNFQNRVNRYDELNFMLHNSGLMTAVWAIYATETTSADEQDRIIGCKGKTKEREKKFYKWMADVGYNNAMLKAIASDITRYGDAFTVASIDFQGDGIVDVTQVSPYECKDKLMFQGVKAMASMKDNKYGSELNSRHKTLQDLTDMFSEGAFLKEDYSSQYKSYLFGYDFSDSPVPPWAVAHFCRSASSSEFYPFGRPMFIGSLARYKSYMTTEMLIDAARVASFPTKVYTVAGDPDMSAVDYTQKINEVRQMYQNITQATEQPDEISVGEAVWAIKDVVEFEQFESRINLNDLGDLEAKLSDLIMSTFVPEGYLNPDKGGFGSSGQSLLQQAKMVARRIFENQTAMLETLAEQYKLHTYITEGAEAEDFELFMNFPVVEESSDRMRIKSDSIRLATDILSNIGTSIGLDRGEALPVEMVADVFGKYSFLDMEEIAEWMKMYTESKDTELLEKIDKKDRSTFSALLTKLSFDSSSDRIKGLKEKIDTRVNETVIREAYFKCKKENGLYEGVHSNKHYYGGFTKGKSPYLDISIKEASTYKEKLID